MVCVFIEPGFLYHPVCNFHSSCLEPLIGSVWTLRTSQKISSNVVSYGFPFPTTFCSFHRQTLIINPLPATFTLHVPPPVRYLLPPFPHFSSFFELDHFLFSIFFYLCLGFYSFPVAIFSLLCIWFE